MSFSDRLVLWLHIAVAIFTLGPVTAAIMSTPRYIRNRDAAVVGFLLRITRVYAAASLLVFVLGIVLAQMHDDFSKPWVSISMTLFVVALVLLVLIIRDQGKALTALREAAALSAQQPAAVQPSASGKGDAAPASTDSAKPAKGTSADLGASVAGAGPIAAVERGRIVSLGGVTTIIWLVILVLMIWK